MPLGTSAGFSPHVAFGGGQDGATSGSGDTTKNTQQPDEQHVLIPEEDEEVHAGEDSSGGAGPADRGHEFEIRNLNLMEDNGVHVSLEDFELLRMLGAGSFGKVFLVKKKGGRDDGTLYAMKVLTKATLKVRDRLRTKAERDILVSARNPFIVRLHYAFQTSGKLYLVLTYVRGGDLFTRLNSEVLFTERDVKIYLAEICLAFEHLHKLGIVYRDLKPENILLGADGHIMITDFGLSKDYVHADDAEEGKTFSFCGTVEYMAPEVVARKGHDKTADWWSFGVLMYEMLTGGLPFQSSNRKTLMKMILSAKLEMPREISHEAQSLLRQVFRRDPKRRLGFNGADEIKSHSFFQEIDWEKLSKKEIAPPFKPHLTSDLDTSNFDEEYTSQQPMVTPGVPQTARTMEVFRGFSFDGSAMDSTADAINVVPEPLTSYPRPKTVPITDIYDIEEVVIGHGTFSQIRRAQQKLSRKTYAVKIIDKSKRSPTDEIDILYRYGGHPNILTLIEVYEDAANAYLVMELVGGGELLDLLFVTGTVSEEQVRGIMQKLVEVLDYLHQNGVVHRDLKPSNILFTDDTFSPEGLRLADFGFAKQLTAENGMLMTPCYTANFVAPEVLRKQGYDKACDIWSVGVLFYTLLGGGPPFASTATDGEEEILARIERSNISFVGPTWQGVSDQCKQLILQMLDINPANRPSTADILQGPWMQNEVQYNAATAAQGTVLPSDSGVKAAVENTLQAYPGTSTKRAMEQPGTMAPVKFSTLISRRKHKHPSVIMESNEEEK